MDKYIFMRFIQNILNIKVYSYLDNEKAYTDFEEECCFEKSIQPMYSSEGLKYIVENLSAQTFYEITDNLSTSLLIFKFEGEVYSVGPYVKTLFSKSEIQKLLVTNHLPASLLFPLKLYHEKFPQLSYFMVNGAVTAAMKTFVPNNPVYNFRLLTGFHEELKKETLIKESNTAYAQIIQQYEMENFFLRKITEGDVTGVKLAFENIVSNFYINSSPAKKLLYSTNSNGFAIIRTLARKAAEQGGASVVTIDDITQEGIQRYNTARTASEIEAAQKDMLLSLTKAVADAKYFENYSPVIRSVLGYILANYSDDISLANLATKYHVSSEHLSRLFKKEIGETITDYITSIRIKKAAELLLSSSIAISEIALYVGYPDSNYFVKKFKRIYGMTPSSYRKSYSLKKSGENSPLNHQNI